MRAHLLVVVAGKHFQDWAVEVVLHLLKSKAETVALLSVDDCLVPPTAGARAIELVGIGKATIEQLPEKLPLCVGGQAGEQFLPASVGVWWAWQAVIQQQGVVHRLLAERGVMVLVEPSLNLGAKVRLAAPVVVDHVRTGAKLQRAMCCQGKT